MFLTLSNFQSLGQLASSGSGNALVPLGSKPLPGTMLTNIS